MVSYGPQEKERLSDRPLFPINHVFCERPFVFLAQVRHEVMDSFLPGEISGCRVRPQVIRGRGKQLADGSHGIEVEEGITVRLGPCGFMRATAISGHLRGKKYGHTVLEIWIDGQREVWG